MRTFYWYFRPIAVASKISGVFPIENVTSLDTSRLQFRAFSWSSLYTFLVFCFYSCTFYYFTDFIFYVPPSKIYISYVTGFIAGRSVISFMFCYGRLRKLPKLIRLLDTFDQRKSKYLTIPKICTKNKLRMIIFPVLLVSLCSFFTTFLSSQLVKKILPPDVVDNVKGTIACCFFSFLSSWQIYPSFLFIYFAVRITQNLHEINISMQQQNLMQDYFNDTTKFEPEMHQTLANIRLLHNMLSDCVHELGKCYGSFLAVDHLCIIAVFVLNISVFIYESNHDPHLLLLTVGNGIILMNTISVSHELKKSGSEIINLLHGIPSMVIPGQMQQEINIFFTQLMVRPIQISAGGYFILDKSYTLS
ncbi:hypothetical protein NQ315_000728, partial [Exocentrus adspersus]